MVDTIIIWGPGVLCVWVLRPILGNTSLVSKIAAFRIFRMVRLLHLVRVFQHVHVLKELWLLVRGLVDSLNTLTSAMILIFFCLYLFGILAVELIGAADFSGATDEELQAHEKFDTLFISMLTLYRFTHGDGAQDILDNLVDQLPYIWIFLWIFTALSSCVLLNLVTAVIVQHALDITQADDEMEAAERVRNQDEEIGRLRNVFHRLDTDGSGELTKEEFREAFVDVDFRNTLVVLGFKESELLALFDLLDSDGEGCLNVEEFTSGMAQLRGDAKSKDMILLLKSVGNMERRVLDLKKTLEKEDRAKEKALEIIGDLKYGLDTRLGNSEAELRCLAEAIDQLITDIDADVEANDKPATRSFGAQVMCMVSDVVGHLAREPAQGKSDEARDTMEHEGDASEAKRSVAVETPVSRKNLLEVPQAATVPKQVSEPSTARSNDTGSKKSSRRSHSRSREVRGGDDRPRSGRHKGHKRPTGHTSRSGQIPGDHEQPPSREDRQRSHHHHEGRHEGVVEPSRSDRHQSGDDALRKSDRRHRSRDAGHGHRRRRDPNAGQQTGDPDAGRQKHDSHSVDRTSDGVLLGEVVDLHKIDAEEEDAGWRPQTPEVQQSKAWTDHHDVVLASLRHLKSERSAAPSWSDSDRSARQRFWSNVGSDLGSATPVSTVPPPSSDPGSEVQDQSSLKVPQNIEARGEKNSALFLPRFRPRPNSSRTTSSAELPHHFYGADTSSEVGHVSNSSARWQPSIHLPQPDGATQETRRTSGHDVRSPVGWSDQGLDYFGRPDLPSHFHAFQEATVPSQAPRFQPRARPRRRLLAS